MVNNTLLSIRPDYEIVTRYAAAWQINILSAADGVGLPYVDLYGSDATTSNFYSSLEATDPLIINILGHGNYNSIACQGGQTLMTGADTKDLAERVVYDLSCRAGRDLGTAAINNGCISFLGYTEDFWVCYVYGDHADGGMLNPLNDETARGFLESHNIAPISFIQGSTTGASYSASQNRFNYWIRVWEQVDSGVTAHLVWNRDHQVLKGVGVAPPGPGIGPALLMFAPLLFIPISKHLKKLKTL